MQVTNEQKLEKMLNANMGYITRKQVDEQRIPSWFLTDFVRKNALVKIDKGIYALEDWLRDDFLVFQAGDFIQQQRKDDRQREGEEEALQPHGNRVDDSLPEGWKGEQIFIVGKADPPAARDSLKNLEILKGDDNPAHRYIAENDIP